MNLIKNTQPPMNNISDDQWPDASICDSNGFRFLRLGGNDKFNHGQMLIEHPQFLCFPPVVDMMTWLLFFKPESIVDRRAMQLGLGGGSASKFCHQVLQMDTTAVEINPKVVAACKRWFALTPEDGIFRIRVGDAATVVLETQYLGKIDTLQIDLYDFESAAPALDSVKFYSDCRALLTPDGILTMNVLGNAEIYNHSLKNLSIAFGADAIWNLKSGATANTIVLAHRHAVRPNANQLLTAAKEISKRWGLPAMNWYENLYPGL